MIELFQPRTTYRINYASNCLVNSQPDFRAREITVRGIRDLLLDPLTPDEFISRPLLRRSRWLIKTRDPGIPREFRQFYAGSMQEHWEDSILRIGWYDLSRPGSPPVFKSALAFQPKAYDRFTLARLLIRWKDRDFKGYALRVFAEDSAAWSEAA